MKKETVEKWRTKGFDKPTAIQEQSYDVLSKGNDVVAVSPTGTGKTLAYVLPIIERLEKNNTLQLVVLAPSQELAQQIAQVVREWSELLVVTITGGANLKRQIENLKKKPEIIVATPGRLREIIMQSKKIKWHTVEAIVLDEADQLLKDETIGAVRDIVKKAPSQRQLVFVSATSSDKLENVSQWFNTNPTYINVENATQDVQHIYFEVQERKRAELLRKLAQVDNMKAMVFVQNIANLALLYEKMVYENIPVALLNSEQHHIKRQQAMQAFKNNEVTYLLTTDITARGMDIENLPYVINYDLPREKEIYTHRSGRTGRMGKEGAVISFVEVQKRKEYFGLLPENVKADKAEVHSKQIYIK